MATPDPSRTVPTVHAPHASAVSRPGLSILATACALALCASARLPAQGVLWTQALNGPTKLGHAMAYDAARGEIVLFGESTAATSNETWVFDGTTWTRKFPSTSPPGRANHAMAYDAARQQVVLFGGMSPPTATTLGDTWVWNGTGWQDVTPQQPGVSPAARAGHSMAYDAARGVVVLHGGQAAPATPLLNDTWVWNGTGWTQMSPATSPPAGYPALAYDCARELVVLVSQGPPGASVDTWEWNGTNWTQMFPLPPSPSARYAHTVAFDVARQRTVLFGGMAAGTINPAPNDTWEWDGTTWTRTFPAQSPPARRSHAMAYDAARERMVLFGGWNGNSTGPQSFNDTWEYASLTPATFTPYGSGCGNPLTLTAPCSRPWIGDTFTVEVGNLQAGSNPYLMMGFAPAQVPLPPIFPGCIALLLPVHAQPLIPNGSTATWSLPLPGNPGLIGVALYLQGASLHVPRASLALSGGGHATVGMR